MPDEKTLKAAQLYHETFHALRREHRCRKNAVGAAIALQRQQLIHEPTPREIALLRWHDNAHTVAFGQAEELLEKLEALEELADLEAEEAMEQDDA